MNRGGGRHFGYRRGRGDGRQQHHQTHGNASQGDTNVQAVDRRHINLEPIHAGPTEEGAPRLWRQYFPHEGYVPEDRRSVLIKEMCDFFCSVERGGKNMIELQLARSKKSMNGIAIPMDWRDVKDRVPELKEAMHHSPAEAMQCMEIAIFECLWELRLADMHFPHIDVGMDVCVRLYNYSNDLDDGGVHAEGAHEQQGILYDSIGSIKAQRVGKLVQLRGTVTRISPVKYVAKSMEFTCMRCKAVQKIYFVDGVYAPAVVCTTDFCRSRYMKANIQSSKCIDWQRIHLQALSVDEKRTGESVQGAALPSHPIEVELSKDLVESCYPGDVVSVTGIVKVLRSDSGRKGIDAKRARLFVPYIDAISLQRMEGSGLESSSEEELIVPRGPSYLPPTMTGFTSKDLNFIRAFASKCHGRHLEVLVQSLAPGIYGLDLIKAGLILSLFGGLGHRDMDENVSQGLRVRGDIHVLLVGDPGLGKSRLLQAVAAASPRGVYVCGPSASAAGLTLSVNKNSGEFSLEAGALVIADRGVCCVDEFDKVSSEHAALLGALEQQEVSIAKAGLLASLPARTTVIAAANPVEGHYNKSLTLAQNLKMSPAMISRFDMVFLMLDRPDEEADKKLAGHIMTREVQKDIQNSYSKSQESLESLELGASRRSLKSRLQIPLDCDNLPPQLLRKLIAYARQYVHPRLSEDSKKVIKTFYLKLRQRSAGDISSATVTHRLLESIIRLSEARARVELREVVTAEDVLDAIDIIEETLHGSLYSGPDTIIFDSIPSRGKGKSSAGARIKQEKERFLRAVQRHCQKQQSKEIAVHELFSIADEIDLAIEDTAGFIEHLNDQGDLLKKGNSIFQYHGKL